MYAKELNNVNKVVQSFVDKVVDGSFAIGANNLPYNFTTKKEYHGFHILVLWTEKNKQGWSSNGWATLKQILAKGMTLEHSQGEPVKLLKLFGDDERGWTSMEFEVYNSDQVIPK